jgi:hypothetical protein
MEFDLDTGRELLERTPQALRALLAGLSPAWTDADEGPDTWSPRAVVVHLIHAERDNWLPRARVFVEHGNAHPFPPFDQSSPLEAFAGVPLDALLDDFVRLRAESLAALDAWKLGDGELAAVATHPRFGEVRLRQLLSAWVTHDLAHLAQVSRVMAKQYRDAVGPWRVFLPILDR